MICAGWTEGDRMSEILYKFLSAENALKVLESREIKVSLLHELNDIYDCAPIMSASNERGELVEIESWEKVVKYVSQLHGILCFSEDYRSPLLWGHYASCSTGIALGFDPAFFSWPNQIPIRVKYQDSRPTLHLPKTEDPDVDVQVRYQEELYGVKAQEWYYEQETRYVLRLCHCEPRGGMYFAPFFGRALRQVIIGPRSRVKRSYCQDFLNKRCDGLGVELYVAKAHPTKYEVQISGL
jgi:Protein of unknown function (DUF2971)